MHMWLFTKLGAVNLRYWIVLAILLLASFLRLYKLGEVPHGMTWDEAAIGYNGFATLTTRRDEWLTRLPISFKSFGDYKAPVAIYLNGPFTYFLGMKLWVVRLPFALTGILTCLLFYLLLLQLLKEHRQKNSLSIIGLALFAFSPWHIHFSRVGFESGLSLFFLLVGWVSVQYFFSSYKKISLIKNYILLFVCTVALALSIYAYHSAKIFVPLLCLVMLIQHRAAVMQTLKYFLAPAGLFFMGLLVPLIKDSMYGNGAERAGVLYILEKISLQEKFSLFLNNSLVHLSPKFMIFGATDTLRHGVGAWSVLLPVTYSLLLLGTIVALLPKLRKKFLVSELSVLGLVIVIIGFLPAVLTREVPHANRALFALPGCIILAISGIEVAYAYVSEIKNQQQRKIVFKIIVGLAVSLEIFFGLSFQKYYYREFAQKSAPAFQDGYLEAFQIAREYERGINGRPEVQQILFDDSYGQPYIYALFVRRTNPIWYQSGSLVKYQFTNKISQSDLERENTLVVASPNARLPLERASHLVYGSDGSIRFAIYYTGKKYVQ